MMSDSFMAASATNNVQTETYLIRCSRTAFLWLVTDTLLAVTHSLCSIAAMRQVIYRVHRLPQLHYTGWAKLNDTTLHFCL